MKKVRVLDCNPQNCKPCNCPAVRLKKEPRDINNLLDRESYKSEAESRSGTPLWVADGRQDRAAIFTPGRGKEDTIYKGELTLGWLISYQGNQWMGQGASGKH